MSHPKMMSVGLHCRIADRSARAVALKRFLRYAKETTLGLVCAPDRDRELVGES